MELELTTYRCLPCSTECFKINGIDADEYDFGGKTIGGDCMENTCYCRFEKKLPSQAILDKYNITVDEYALVCEELEIKLNVYNCGWCS